MGGANAGTINPVQNASSGVGQMNSLRVHEDTTKGEVHLHDDNAGLKFACPNAEFNDIWHKGVANSFSMPVEVLGHDGNKNPMMAVFSRVVKNGVMDLSVEIKKASFGANFQAIKKVVEG